MTSHHCLILTFLAWLALHQPLVAPSLDPEPQLEPLVIRQGETASQLIVHKHQLRILGRVKGNILVLGNDAIIEGRVEGAAMAIGGSIRQRSGGFIGGDVVVIGGEYERAPDARPLGPESKVLLIPAYGEVFRAALRNPWKSLLLPEPTPMYIGLRVLGVLLYFLVALLLIAVIPGPLTRAIQSLRQNFLRISMVGLAALFSFIGLTALILRFLPNNVSLLLIIFALLLYVAVSLFGSLSVHLVIGRWIQKRLGRGDHSNIKALLYALALTAILSSIPGVGVLTRLGIIILSFGIVATLPFSKSQRLI